MSWRRLARTRDSSAEGRVPAGAPEGGDMAPAEHPLSPGTFFRRVRPVWMALAAASLVYYGWAVFAPATIPYDYLGPLGTITRYLVENHRASLTVGFGFVWLLHLFETLHALKLCRDKGITDGPTQFRWAIQTFWFGILSLFHLLSYNPPKKKKHSEGFDRKKN